MNEVNVTDLKGLLGFLFDAPYDSRRVLRYQDEYGILVSTCSVNDAQFPYETGVAHPEYSDGGVVVVENYLTKEAAEAGHKKWVALMTGPDLPEKLVEVGTAAAALMGDDVDDDATWRIRPRKKQK